ncbi:DNA-binding transcriptional ArsR family regulator [Thermocatellispora tengchongensis]|uniref:DNA-binding transcriptional ArsR family regulator n=2 Tax=Thermocatellispora tengchongensis TaxID=1073253 RepID=A0A840PG72_9ACTN|nr:winged helix-turn-helix domain-containing protein [Thermocatellispora tengchongensis]MBB5137989.1 DNA-binding transcriptional ArsR family regulator [Thermocatellispora tengchongensis]
MSVSISPQVTTLAVLADAVAGRRRGLPEPWRRAVQEAVAPEGWEATRPLGVPGHSVAPDSIVPLTPVGDIPVEFQVAWLRDVPPEVLMEDLEQAFGGENVPTHWQAAVAHPKRWLHGYATAVDNVWSVVEPLWQRARQALDREVERVGAAVVRGGLDALLGTLSDRIVYTGGALRISDLQPSGYDLGERRLVLVPTLAGRDSVIVNLDNPGMVWIAYPVPGADRLWYDQGEQRRGEELAAVLGDVRAGLLAALARPTTMSRLAGQAGTVPSAITYHCDRLAAAGLITRERRGREVWVSRTRRGDALLDLFEL